MKGNLCLMAIFSCLSINAASNLGSQKEVKKPFILKDGSREIYRVALSPDGKMLASVSTTALGSCNNIIRLWDISDLTNAKHFATLKNPYEVLTMRFSLDGMKLILDTLHRKNSCVWNIETRKQIETCPHKPTSIGNIGISENHVAIQALDNRTTIQLLDHKTVKKTGVLTGHTHKVRRLAFSADENTLASASEKNVIRLWDVKTRKQIGIPLTGQTDAISSLALDLNGTRLAASSHNGTIAIWRLTPDRLKQQIIDFIKKNKIDTKGIPPLLLK